MNSPTEQGSPSEDVLTSENKRLRNKSSRLTKESLKLEGIIKTLEHVVKEEKSKAVVKANEIQGLTAEVAKCKTDISNLSQQKCVQNEALLNLKAELELEKKECLEKKIELEQAKTEAANVHQKYSDLEKQLKMKEEVIDNLNNNLEETKKALLERENVIKEERDKKESLEMNILNMNKKVDTLQNQLNIEKQKSEEVHKAYYAASCELDIKRDMLAKKDQRLKKQSSKLHDSWRTSFLRKKKLDEQELTIEMLNKDKAEIKTNLSECEQKLQSQLEATSNLQALLKTAEDNIRDYKTQQESATVELNELSLSAEIVKKEREQVSAVLALEKEKGTDLQAQLEECTAKCDNYKAEVDQNLLTINALERQSSEYELKLTEQQATFDEKVEKLEDTVASQQARLNLLERFVDEDHRSRVDSEEKYKRVRDLISEDFTVDVDHANTCVSIIPQTENCQVSGESLNSRCSPPSSLQLSQLSPSESQTWTCPRIDVNKNGPSSTKNLLDTHILQDGKITCPHCSRKFKNKAAFMSHLRGRACGARS